MSYGPEWVCLRALDEIPGNIIQWLVWEGSSGHTPVPCDHQRCSFWLVQALSPLQASSNTDTFMDSGKGSGLEYSVLWGKKRFIQWSNQVIHRAFPEASIQNSEGFSINPQYASWSCDIFTWKWLCHNRQDKHMVILPCLGCCNKTL